MPEEVIIEKELLEALYWGNFYSSNQIAKLFDISDVTIRRKLRKYNIEVRTSGESQIGISLLEKGHKINCICSVCKQKRGEFITDIIRKKMSKSRKGKVIPKEVGEKISKSLTGKHPSNETIEKMRLITKELWKREGFRENFINKMKGHIPWNKGIYGEKSHTWRGGLSLEPYTYDWNRIKTVSLEYHGKICHICGKITSDLCVHHANYNKLDNRLENLIPLCRKCHSKTNFHRDIWYTLFCIGHQFDGTLTDVYRKFMDEHWKNCKINEEDII